MKTALVEGASTAYGYGSGRHGGWASALQRDSVLYGEAHPMDPFVVTNLSIPGMTISGINRRFAESQQPRLGAHNSLVRIISVGENEARIPPDRDMPIVNLGSFATQLAIFHKATHEIGASSILVGPHHIDESLTLPCGDTGWRITNENIDEYAEAVRLSALEQGAPYIDVVDVLSSYPTDKVLASDGRHPSALGHSLIYSAVKDSLISTGFVKL